MSENPPPLEKAWLNYEIGHCYFEDGQLERAREYGEMALESAREADDHLWQLNTTVLLAQILGWFSFNLEDFMQYILYRNVCIALFGLFNYIIR